VGRKTRRRQQSAGLRRKVSGLPPSLRRVSGLALSASEYSIYWRVCVVIIKGCIVMMKGTRLEGALSITFHSRGTRHVIFCTCIGGIIATRAVLLLRSSACSHHGITWCSLAMRVISRFAWFLHLSNSDKDTNIFQRQSDVKAPRRRAGSRHSSKTRGLSHFSATPPFFPLLDLQH